MASSKTGLAGYWEPTHYARIRSTGQAKDTSRLGLRPETNQWLGLDPTIDVSRRFGPGYSSDDLQRMALEEFPHQVIRRNIAGRSAEKEP